MSKVSLRLVKNKNIIIVNGTFVYEGSIGTVSPFLPILAHRSGERWRTNPLVTMANMNAGEILRQEGYGIKVV